MNRTAILYALASAALFGLATPAAKVLLGSIHPAVLAGLFYCGAGIGVAVLRRLRMAGLAASGTEEVALTRRDVPWLAGAIFCGGIVGPLLAQQPAALVIANRSTERALQVVAQFGGAPALAAHAFAELASLPPFDVVVNATSVGLKGEPPPFPAGLLNAQSFCYDLVYGSSDTPFITWARSHGAARAVQGFGMLVEQAAESFFIWRGVRPDTKPLLRQLAR